MMLAVGLSYIAFTMFRYIPSIPSFPRSFIMKWCWILLKAFSHLLRWSVIFVFASINVLYYIYRFAYVEPSLHPWDEADLAVLNDLSMCCRIWFAIILLRIFLHPCSLRRLAYSSSFWRCLWFSVECNTGFMEWVRQSSFPFNFVEKFKDSRY
jgi:hypothetical protein